MTMTIVSPYIRHLTKGQPFGLSLTESMIVQSIASTSQAVTRGVKVNSRLVAVDNQSVTFSELAGVLGSKPNGQGVCIDWYLHIWWWRSIFHVSFYFTHCFFVNYFFIPLFFANSLCEILRVIIEIEFTFVPPVFVDGPTITAVAASVAPVQAVRASQAAPSPQARPVASPAAAAASSAPPPPAQPRPPPQNTVTRRMTIARRGRSYMSGEDHDVKLQHRQLGFAVQACEGDEGLLRVTDVRPTARTAGVGLGELVIAVNIPCTVAAFTQIVADSPRPIEIKLFRWYFLLFIFFKWFVHCFRH
jgi:hypothetical protein